MKQANVVIALAVALCTGCASTGSLSGEMAEFQGEPVSAATDSWGQPEAEYAEAGQTVLVWRDRSPFAALHDAPSAGVICERMLAVDAEGTVTGWRWRGDACQSVPTGNRSRELAASLR